MEMVYRRYNFTSDGYNIKVHRVSVPSPTAIDILMDTMARDREN